MEEWVLHARRFIALGKKEFLEKAREVCKDKRIRKFLGREDVVRGSVDPEALQPLAERLKARGRESEAVMVEILRFRGVGLAADSPLRLGKEARQFTREVCSYLFSISREEGFLECEALFARALGTRAGRLRESEEADALLRHSLRVYRNLAEKDPDVYRWDVAVALNNLGTVLRGSGQLRRARVAYEEAVGIYRELGEREPEVYRAVLADTLNNLGNLLANDGEFTGARRALGEALNIRRELSEKRPRIYRRDVAGTLNGLGNVLYEERDFPAAREAYEEAVATYRELAGREPHIHRPDVAMTLNNLGNVLREERNLPAAREAYEEAVATYRELAERKSNIYRPYVATALNNLGNVLREERDLPAAREAFEEALATYRELAEKEPHIYRPYVAMTLNNLGNVLERVDDGAGAVEVSREGVEAAEAGTDDPVRLHLAKGNATGAYRRYAARLASGADADGLFRCLAAMREGPVRALGDEPKESLEAAAIGLGKAEDGVGRRIWIVVAENLTREGALLAVLSSEKPYLQFERGDQFGAVARKILQEVIRVFPESARREGPVSREILRGLGKEAWNELPGFVRETLDPRAEHDVLISGDAFWTAFPWEALWCGDAGPDEETGWLGLRRHLARWGPLTAAGLGRLRPVPFGGGERTAGIICPWDAVAGKELPLSMMGARELATDLRGRGYELVPEGEPLIGDAATRLGVAEILRRAPSLIHYSSHGSIVGNEEVLVLSGGQGKGHTYFGRKEIEDLRARLGAREKLLTNGPLVVLNSCLTGRTRGFGGQREDLAWAFLDEGAEAVIASALPIFEGMGWQFDRSLYTDEAGAAFGMAWSFGMARAVVEKVWRENDSPLWPAWTLFSYHGNPYARLPHTAEGRKEKGKDRERGWGAEMLKRLAEMLHLREAEEAARVLEEMRGRLS